MMITEKNRATSMVVFVMVALNGLFLFGNGLFMLVAPSAWYHFVPGVIHTGPFDVPWRSFRHRYDLTGESP
jgi:hypothetical protein